MAAALARPACAAREHVEVDVSRVGGAEFKGDGVSMREPERRRETIEEARGQVGQLRRHDMVMAERKATSPTPSGWQLACAIVRNHRLWELYLTNAAHIAADHVHEDAEKIEHVLGEDVVRELERRWSTPRLTRMDGASQALPTCGREGQGRSGSDELVGYGRRP